MSSRTMSPSSTACWAVVPAATSLRTTKALTASCPRSARWSALLAYISTATVPSAAIASAAMAISGRRFIGFPQGSLWSWTDGAMCWREGDSGSADELDGRGAAIDAYPGSAGGSQALGEPAVDTGLRRRAVAGSTGDRVASIAGEAETGEEEGAEAAYVVGTVAAGQPVRAVVHRDVDDGA